MRVAIARLAAGAALALAGIVASAQDYPARPVKIVVPFAAGGPADVYARFLAQRLGEAMGQPFVVDDRPGAGSVIGTDAVAKSAPDGYTLLVMSNTQTVNESLMPNKPYQLLRDLTPVAPINYSDLVMVVHPSVKANTLAEFIALAKAEPGKLNYASSGPGTPYHMAGELFKVMAGVDIVHVPYKGSSGARTDLLGGQVQMMFDAVTTMGEHVKTGKARALGTTGKTRSSVLPNVPTISEAGVVGYEATIWLGVMAPKNTPQPIVNRLNAEISKITSNPEVRAEWAKQGAIAMTMTPDEFARYVTDDVAKWEKIVRNLRREAGPVIELAIISAGAAKAVVNAVRADFRDAGDAEVLATFGAVGAMRARLLEGNPCDLIILTAPMIEELEHEGRAVTGTSARLGRVHTGIAVRTGSIPPVIADQASLARTLTNATSLYVPDTERSTAGRHVVEVLQALGIGAALAPRLRRFESGATAMGELASSTDERALGCTQISEILYTPGVALVGPLPEAFDLATTYSAAIAASARHPELARRFLHVLTGPATSDLRRHAGFEATDGLRNT